MKTFKALFGKKTVQEAEEKPATSKSFKEDDFVKVNMPGNKHHGEVGYVHRVVDSHKKNPIYKIQFCGKKLGPLSYYANELSSAKRPSECPAFDKKKKALELNVAGAKRISG